VLIVEHNRNLRLLIEEELASEGYHTLTAASAPEAIERLNARTPDLVVLDLRLPGTHGARLAEDLRAIHPRLPIVVHTGDAAYHQNFEPRAADACVLKSSNLRKLTDTIRHILAMRRPSPRARRADLLEPALA